MEAAESPDAGSESRAANDNTNMESSAESPRAANDNAQIESSGVAAAQGEPPLDGAPGVPANNDATPAPAEFVAPADPAIDLSSPAEFVAPADPPIDLSSPAEFVAPADPAIDLSSPAEFAPPADPPIDLNTPPEVGLPPDAGEEPMQVVDTPPPSIEDAPVLEAEDDPAPVAEDEPPPEVEDEPPPEVEDKPPPEIDAQREMENWLAAAAISFQLISGPAIIDGELAAAQLQAEANLPVRESQGSRDEVVRSPEPVDKAAEQRKADLERRVQVGKAAQQLSDALEGTLNLLSENKAPSDRRPRRKA